MVKFKVHKNAKSFGYSPTLPSRLMEKGVKTAKQCFEFAHGFRNEKGYGWINAGPRMMYTHRVAYELFNGEKLAESEVVMHKCHNPKCFNPAHLVKGDILLNNQDKVENGSYRVKNKNKRSCTLRPEQVLAIRIALKMQTLSLGAISRACNCSYKQVKDIKHGVTWKNIQLDEKPVFEFDTGYDPFLDDQDEIPLKSPRKRPERVPAYLRDSYEAYVASLQQEGGEDDSTAYDPFSDE